MQANSERLEWQGYYLLSPKEVGKPTPYYWLAFFDAKHRQRRTRSTSKTNAGEAFEYMIRFARDNPLPAAAVSAEDTGVERGTMAAVLGDATTEAQQLIDVLAKLASETVEGAATAPGAVVAAHNLPLRVCVATYRAFRPQMVNESRPAESLAHAVHIWGKDVTVRQLTGPMQHRFINRMRAMKNASTGLRRYTDNTITTRLACLWAAMHCCADELGILERDAIPSRVPTDKWQPRAQLNKRRLRGFGLDDLVKFVAASFSCRRWLRNTIINLNLVPRPDDGNDLQPCQVDRPNRVVYLRPLKADGTLEDVSKKRSATVKYGESMARWFEFWEEEDKQRPKWMDPHYVLFAGKRMDSFDWVHRVARRAGIRLPKGMGAYLFRHFIASYLVANGCPIPQVKMLLGHDVVDGATAFYVELEPAFLDRVVELIQQLIHEIDQRLPRGMSLLNPSSVPEEPPARIEVMSDDAFYPELDDQPLPDEDDVGLDVWDNRTKDLWTPAEILRGSCVAVRSGKANTIFNIEAPAPSWERTSNDALATT